MGNNLNTDVVSNSNFMRIMRTLKTKLSPFLGAAIICLFLYWIWTYKEAIASIFKKLGFAQLAALIVLFAISMILAVFVVVILTRSKGYAFKFSDGYHTLNLSQLAAMIPGGIWGYAGFASILWSKGISKIDSVIIILLNTMIMLSACAIVGISGLVSILGWQYAMACLIPFFALVFGRDWLDKIRQKYYPNSSPLPSVRVMLKTLLLGITVWIIESLCFAWVLYSSEGFYIAPLWTVVGAYATGYLGGYITIFVPSGIGVSEGLITLMLDLYASPEKILTVAIVFRIIRTFIVWCNILLSAIITVSSKNQ